MLAQNKGNKQDQQVTSTLDQLGTIPLARTDKARWPSAQTQPGPFYYRTGEWTFTSRRTISSASPERGGNSNARGPKRLSKPLGKLHHSLSSAASAKPVDHMTNFLSSFATRNIARIINPKAQAHRHDVERCWQLCTKTATLTPGQQKAGPLYATITSVKSIPFFFCHPSARPSENQTMWQMC
ncbi:hypothetical protein LX32DRAFT_215864 [Colletotrichum zoysiae]|uniref:Uncharacterized protein n=1 Tax=Colletotrichum zoysiae TaxID=1216348 RepID=A0AAD9H584_9PEZI|nr:hypothetical protein LX32DRAFT_215864 [Colletotrichum zoysiae]